MESRLSPIESPTTSRSHHSCLSPSNDGHYCRFGSINMTCSVVSSDNLSSVMRQSQVGNASKEKNVHENASDKPQIMTSAEVSFRKKRKRKRRPKKGHGATESNDNLSAVPKDAFLTETCTAALAVPAMHPDEHSLNSVMRQSQVDNASKKKNVHRKKRWKKIWKKMRKKGHDATESNHNLSAVLSNDNFSAIPKEKNVLENSLEKSKIMTSAEVRVGKKRSKKRRKKARDATKRNDNLSAVQKDAFSTETSTSALALPPTHLDKHSLNSVMRQALVENASKKKKVKNRGKRRRKKRHDASENNNLSAIPKGTLSVETSTVAMVMPPSHPFQHPVDPIIGQFLGENERKEFPDSNYQSDSLPNLTSVLPSHYVSLEQTPVNAINYIFEEPQVKAVDTEAQQIETVSSPVDALLASQFNHDPVKEPLQQLQQLPSVELLAFNLGTSGELLYSSQQVEPVCRSNNEASLPLAAFKTQLLDPTPSEINNHLTQIVTQSMDRMHSALVADPLKNELDRLLGESEQTMKHHKETKLRLKSDGEREIEEVHRKYDIKLQENELEFQQRKKNLDTRLSLVLMNKLWAEAFSSKCMDLEVFGVPEIQQDSSFKQQSDTRPSSTLAASPPHGPPASNPQHFATAAISQTMVPPPASSMQTFSAPASSQILVTPVPTAASSSPLVPPLPTTTRLQTMAPPQLAAYNAPPRPPCNNSIPPSANHQAGTGLCATPHHL
ncbi:uncharacterized protein LOC114733592 isoform X2 [Neltuma alba]|uniref:uncharacterized protein LOC114733592 isoform X2 n=1 Tax=Neltuma alba TaxID=207710 RepID=UPI0010A3C630|nr:uncharacterized protein LOC114733592 isoform X2 [Prosopis alba]